MPFLLPAYEFEIDFSEIENSLPRRDPEALILSTAKTGTGISTFELVDKGRKGFSAKGLRGLPGGAKALKIPVQFLRRKPKGVKDGFIFRRSVGPVKPQNIRAGAKATAITAMNRILKFQRTTLFNRTGAKFFVNEMAEVFAARVKSLIKNRSGKLRAGIRVVKAV